MKPLKPVEKPPISHTQLVKYAGASGDFNPIHTVVPIAQKAGLDDCIAHGMLIMGFAGEAITTWFPRKSIQSFSVRFAKMTYPGERLTIYGKLLEFDQEKQVIEGEVLVKNTLQQIKLKGRFTVLVEKEEHL